MHRNTLAALSIGALIGSCGMLAAFTTNPEPREPAPLALVEGAEGEYTADAVHSSTVYRIKHAGTANFYGRFNKISGTFTLAENPDDMTFDLTIDTSSVDTANDMRDEHLRSPDFFNTQQFPTATFKSTAVSTGEGNKLRLTGDLTLNGVTRPITADLELTGTGQSRRGPIAGFEARFEINRQDFGVSYAGPLGDDVLVIVSVEGVQGAGGR